MQPCPVSIRFLGTATVSSIALPNVVLRAAVLHLVAGPETKFVPLMVNVKAAPPDLAELRLMLVIVGLRGLMVNVAPAEATLVVVTSAHATPGVAISLAGTANLSEEIATDRRPYRSSLLGPSTCATQSN